MSRPNLSVRNQSNAISAWFLVDACLARYTDRHKAKAIFPE